MSDIRAGVTAGLLHRTSNQISRRKIILQPGSGTVMPRSAAARPEGKELVVAELSAGRRLLETATVRVSAVRVATRFEKAGIIGDREYLRSQLPIAPKAPKEAAPK
jgi:hypothetical protein